MTSGPDVRLVHIQRLQKACLNLTAHGLFQYGLFPACRGLYSTR